MVIIQNILLGWLILGTGMRFISPPQNPERPHFTPHMSIYAMGIRGSFPGEMQPEPEVCNAPISRPYI